MLLLSNIATLLIYPPFSQFIMSRSGRTIAPAGRQYSRQLAHVDRGALALLLLNRVGCEHPHDAA
jgi:hypothetical protein